MQLRFLALAVALSLPAAPAAAQSWHAVYVADDALFAVDQASLNSNGDVRIALVSTESASEWRSAWMTARHNCQTGTVQVGTVQLDPASFAQATELSALLAQYASSDELGDVACKRTPMTVHGFRSLEQLAWFARVNTEEFVDEDYVIQGVAQVYAVMSMDPYNWWFVDMTPKSNSGGKRVVDYYTVWPGREPSQDLYSISETEIDCTSRRTRTLRVATGRLESQDALRAAANTAWRGLENHHDERLVSIFCDGAMVPLQVFAFDGAALQTAIHALPRAFYYGN